MGSLVVVCIEKGGGSLCLFFVLASPGNIFWLGLWLVQHHAQVFVHLDFFIKNTAELIFCIGTAPLDRLKVLLQVQAGPAKNASLIE